MLRDSPAVTVGHAPPALLAELGEGEGPGPNCSPWIENAVGYSLGPHGPAHDFLGRCCSNRPRTTGNVGSIIMSATRWVRTWSIVMPGTTGSADVYEPP